MSYEFIIGTIIGIAGLVLTWICSKDQIKNYFRPDMQELLNQLVSRNLSIEEKKKVLIKINRKLKIYGKCVSSEYISSFSLQSTVTSNVLLNICVANGIEPTFDICKSFLGYDSPALRNDYLKACDITKDKTSNENATSNTLKKKRKIERPNTVYVSSILKEKYPHAAEELFSVLRKHQVTLKELTNTNDIWCRDYMPVQNSMGELIQFTYDPPYLKGKKEWEDSKSDVHKVCEANGIKPIYSTIRIDGGNVVMLGDKAILTNRIFEDNPKYEKEALVSEIESLLKAKVFIIPSYSKSDDLTGHADGMVRFVDERTILGNDLSEDYDYIKKGINKLCLSAGLNYIEVPYFIPKKDKNHEMNAIGIYVNYLEVDNLIVLPKFSVEGNQDEKTKELFKKIFPDRIIESIDYNEVAVEGGLLNCTTWTIFE